MLTRLCAIAAMAMIAAVPQTDRMTITGHMTDKETGEPLVGAAVVVEGTTIGAVTDETGAYELEVTTSDGSVSLVTNYIGYKQEIAELRWEASAIVDFELETDASTLGDAKVVGQMNRSSELALLSDRRLSTTAVENLGAREMSVKGIGDVEQGVKRITGVSIADEGQLVVRGLGDRYSITTLNSLPIASPNPDHKLIPLDLFPSSAVESISVTKVYDVTSFADYSGAHIDIGTKSYVSEEFLDLGFSAGGAFNTVGRDFYRMDSGSLFRTEKLDASVRDMALSDFDDLAKATQIFGTSMDVERRAALPDFSGNVSYGRNFKMGGGALSVVASGSIDNSRQVISDAFYKTFEATGNVQNDFSYEGYESALRLTGLASADWKFRSSDHVGYTFLFARDVTDTYQLRTGTDSEDHDLISSNNVTHIYSLMTHQLSGHHQLSGRMALDWNASYGMTSSDEPDRRQVMYSVADDGTISLFKLNRQETMRYYGTLDEDEFNADVKLAYELGEGSSLKLGGGWKDKSRDYVGTRFYYNLTDINPVISDILTPSSWLNMENITDGDIVLERYKQPKDAYEASHRMAAAYALADLDIAERLSVDVGVRAEYSMQDVDYHTDGGTSKHRDLDALDFFPSLNVKYDLGGEHSLRLSLSRTITRPSFIEMSPFLYQESYGSQQIRGNEELDNAFNYNMDVRYEWMDGRGQLFSIAVYYKYLDNPIERIQRLSGGATEHSFQNADNGMAAGVELEFRKLLAESLKVSGNVSLMSTNVKLPEGGAYTNKDRALQGASPILANADVTWSPSFGDRRPLSVALLYNLQGRRIHAVGVSGLGDVVQKPVHTVNANVVWHITGSWDLSFKATDLLNRPVRFVQEIPELDTTAPAEEYRRGTGAMIGLSWKIK